jgi:hypothetical protein
LTSPSESGLLRDVGCEFVLAVTEAAILAFQVAPAATAATVVEERLRSAATASRCSRQSRK